MTYKEIVDNLKDIVFKHKMLVDFGYGDLSDIKVKSQNDTDKGSDGADYPYAFLNPTSHSRVGSSMVYRFNLIVMEMSTDETDSVLDAQSRCHQYIDDIIAKWHFDYLSRKTDINLNYTTTPFKQRFQDTVAGMTAQIEITVSKPLDNCLAPFTPEPIELVWATSTADGRVDPDPIENKTNFGFGNIIITDGNWKNTNRYEVQTPGLYKIVTNLQVTLYEPLPGQILPTHPKLLTRTESPTIITFQEPNIVTGWPTTFVDTSTVYDVYAEWTIPVASIDVLQWELIVLQDNPASQESSVTEKAGSEIKIYKIN